MCEGVCPLDQFERGMAQGLKLGNGIILLCDTLHDRERCQL